MAKYLIVIPDLKMGGITTACRNFCNALFSAGNQVEILIMERTGEVPSDFPIKTAVHYLEKRARYWNLNADQIKQEKNPCKRLSLLLLGMIKKLLNKSELWKKLIFVSQPSLVNYDGVFAYRQNAACYYCALNCIKAAKKYAFVHGDVRFMEGQERTFLKYMPLFDKVIYVSNGVREGFVTKYPLLQRNAATVYNFLDTEQIQHKSEAECIMQSETYSVKIVTVSRIEDITKGISRIPPLCLKLKKDFPNKFHWYVVGDGAEMENCLKSRKEMGLEDCLTFLGSRENPYPYISNADFLVLPSRTEAFPMIVCESLALNTPVVVCRYPAAEEQIENGKNGLVAEQNEEDLYSKITMLMDEKLRNALRQNCQKKPYGNEAAFGQLFKIIECPDNF